MKVPEKLHTQRLRLRRHVPADLDAFSKFLSDPDAVRYMAFTEEQKTPAGAAAMLRWVMDAYESPEPIFSLTIADPETDSYLGSCGLHPAGDGEVEIFFTVVPALKGQGYATEAVRALIEHAAKNSGVGKVVAYVVPENKASVRVVEKLGFQGAGEVRRAAGEAGMDHASARGIKYVKKLD
ncbi:MAG: GNAT family N-acetyltransferase [Rhodospirillaceae bacterium]